MTGCWALIDAKQCEADLSGKSVSHYDETGDNWKHKYLPATGFIYNMYHKGEPNVECKEAKKSG